MKARTPIILGSLLCLIAPFATNSPIKQEYQKRSQDLKIDALKTIDELDKTIPFEEKAIIQAFLPKHNYTDGAKMLEEIIDSDEKLTLSPEDSFYIRVRAQDYKGLRAFNITMRNQNEEIIELKNIPSCLQKRNYNKKIVNAVFKVEKLPVGDYTTTITIINAEEKPVTYSTKIKVRKDIPRSSFSSGIINWCTQGAWADRF